MGLRCDHCNGLLFYDRTVTQGDTVYNVWICRVCDCEYYVEVKRVRV